MGMPKKGTSPIRVNGEDYRWAVSSHNGFMIVIVQKPDKGPKHRAVVNYDVIVTPSIVRRIILDGLKQGWDPDRPEKSSKKGRPAIRIAGLEKYAFSGYRCPFCSKPGLRFSHVGIFKCQACRKSFDSWEFHNMPPLDRS